MRSKLLAIVLCLGGCWDFAALKSEYGADLKPSDLGGGGDLLDLGTEGDMALSLDLAVAEDLPGVDQAVVDLSITADLTVLDLLTPDLRRNTDMIGSCSPELPPADVTLYVLSGAATTNTECTKVAPCSTLDKALDRVPASGATRILMSGGTYSHDGRAAGGLTLILGGFYNNFDCRDPAGQPTVINGSASGQPTLRGVEANGSAPVFEGLTINAPTPANNSTPVTAVRCEGTKECKIINCMIATHPATGGPYQASTVTAIDIQGGSVTIERSVVDVPANINGTVQRALFLCGANATIRDSHFSAGLQDTTGSATVEAVDNGGSCVGNGTNSFVAYRSVFQALGGTNAAALKFNWTQSAVGNRAVRLERSAARTTAGAGAGWGILLQTTAELQLLGSTVNGGMVGQNYGVTIEATTATNPIVQIDDSIIQASTVPFQVTNEPISSVSAFRRNVWNYLNVNDRVIENDGVFVTKMMMLDAFATDMAASPWGEPLFGDPKFAGDGIHLTNMSSLPRDKARNPWGTEGGSFPFDIDGTPNGANGVIDIGADEFSP